MLSLTRKADYAVVALASLARRGAARTSARELADSTHVPLPVLTNVLHQLLRHGLVTSALGSKGGYRLARPPAEISLAELIDAIEGPFKLTLCCSAAEGEPCATDAPEAATCDLEDSCQVKEPLQRVHSSLRQFLNQVSLAHIAFDEVPIGLTATVGVKSRQEQPAVVLEGSGQSIWPPRSDRKE